MRGCESAHFLKNFVSVLVLVESLEIVIHNKIPKIFNLHQKYCKFQVDTLQQKSGDTVIGAAACLWREKVCVSCWLLRRYRVLCCSGESAKLRI